MRAVRSRLYLKLKYRVLLIVLLSVLLQTASFIITPASALESQSDALAYELASTMERWTVSRWGKDCFAWVMCYANEMIDPWVASEAARVGMSDEARDAYRTQFVSDLRLDTSETFLISIFVLGASQVDLRPVPDNITMLGANGTRLRPTRYDSRLDDPITGLVQALVFFPKQDAGQSFALSIRGLGMTEERVFAFNTTNTSGSFNPYEPAQGIPEPEPEPEVIVVTLPKKQQTTGKKAAVKVIEPPEDLDLPPAVPMMPREIPPLFADENIAPESSDMAAFVQSVRDRGNTEQNTSADTSTGQVGHPNQDNSYISRETVLRQFLSLWVDQQSPAMYDMLTSASQKNISRDNFAKEIARASDFRAAVREGYTIEWVGEERARVICYQRFLMFRSLLTRTFGIIREGSSWKIVW